MIAITGSETSRSWKDDNGKTHSVNELLVDTVEFCGDRPSAAKPAEQQAPTPDPDIPDGFEAVNDDFPI